MPVAQLDRAPRYERDGWGFDSLQAYQMKVCSKCEIDYSEPLGEHFNKRSRNEGGWQAWCKKCLSTARKERYSSNKEYYVEKARRHNQGYKKRNVQFMIDFLKEHPCVDCGETDPIVLEFDHRPNSNKQHNVSEMRTLSIETIAEEIKKCDVRCANCHRRKTAIQFGWYKDIEF